MRPSSDGRSNLWPCGKSIPGSPPRRYTRVLESESPYRNYWFRLQGVKQIVCHHISVRVLRGRFPCFSLSFFFVSSTRRHPFVSYSHRRLVLHLSPNQCPTVPTEVPLQYYTHTHTLPRTVEELCDLGWCTVRNTVDDLLIFIGDG